MLARFCPKTKLPPQLFHINATAPTTAAPTTPKPWYTRLLAAPVFVAAAAAELADDEAPEAALDAADIEEDMVDEPVLEAVPEEEVAVSVLVLDAVEAHVADEGRFVTPAPPQRPCAKRMVPIQRPRKNQL